MKKYTSILLILSLFVGSTLTFSCQPKRGGATNRAVQKRKRKMGKRKMKKTVLDCPVKDC